MAALFPDWPEALENTVKIAEACSVDFQFGVYPVSYTHLDVYKRQAKDLEAAVERGLHADIAVLDILLGQDDGITVAKRIFPSATQTQVIFITGYVEYCSSVYETCLLYTSRCV